METKITANTPSAASEETEARRLNAALEASKIGVFEFEPQNNRAFWDERVRELWGIAEGKEITYEIVIGQVHPEDHELHDKGTEQALDPKGSRDMDMEYRVFPADGKPMRWIRAQATCTFDGDTPVRLLGTVQDVTERREFQERNELLLNELRHRVKNTLANVISIVKLSQNDSKTLDEYVVALENRLISLADTHSILSINKWLPISFETILEKEFQAFVGSNTDAYTLTGDPLIISPERVQIMTMVVHELVTNAIKYGALSVPKGSVHIHILQEKDMCHITWEEKNGPKLSRNADPSGGFGSFLLTRVIAGELKANTSLEIKPEGLVYSLKFPLLNGKNRMNEQ